MVRIFADYILNDVTIVLRGEIDFCIGCRSMDFIGNMSLSLRTCI